METIRCFLAIKLDLEVARALAKLQPRLRDFCKQAHIRVSWVPPPNLHVTVRFLGQVTEPMAHALEDMLKPVLARYAPFDLEVAGLGVFPSIAKPRVVWAGLRGGSGPLVEVHRAVSNRLIEAGFHLDDRPLKLHVTLGRVREGAAEPLGPFLTEQEAVWGTTRVRNLYCFRSELKPTGAEYQAVWRVPLSGSAPWAEERTAGAGAASAEEPMNNGDAISDNRSEGEDDHDREARGQTQESDRSGGQLD